MRGDVIGGVGSWEGGVGRGGGWVADAGGVGGREGGGEEGGHGYKRNGRELPWWKEAQGQKECGTCGCTHQLLSRSWILDGRGGQHSGRRRGGVQYRR